MRVELLNDGGYDGLKHLQFPLEVEVCKECMRGVDVHITEILRIGGRYFEVDAESTYYFLDYEYRVVGE